MYRADSVSKDIGSLGYLVAIIASLSFAMQPRSKFIQSLIRNIIFTCVAVPFTIFGLWCAREAKHNTEPAGSKALYNPSAAAVCAIFLFFNVFIVNAFRSVPRFLLSN
jgi:putative Ca2+/H+ antiporter (TMEM165/GDT1 family)